MKHGFNVIKIWQNLSPNRKGVVIISIPLLCLLSSVGVLLWLSWIISSHEYWVQHTQKVRLETRVLLNNLIDAETGIRGYSLTHEPEFLQPYENALEEIPKSLVNLEYLVQDNSRQIKRFNHIESLVTKNLELLEGKLSLEKKINQSSTQIQSDISLESFFVWVQSAKQEMDEIRITIDAFAEEEERLLAQRQRQLEFYRKFNLLFMFFSVVIGLSGGSFAIHLFWQLNHELMIREQKLQLTNQELEQVCDRLERFTTNASHELRTPLAAVLSNAQVALMTPLEDSQQLRQRLEKIVYLTKSISKLINDLLFLARNEAINEKSENPINLNNLVANLWEEWQQKPEMQHLQFHKQLPNNPVIIRGNLHLIEQIITNLWSNCCRYTPPCGKVIISLTTDNQNAVIKVTDTGVGIAPEALPYIFERFYRENRVPSQREEGFGLGLAIVQQIIKAHHGEITVTSQPEKGSTFIVTFPLASPKTFN